MSASPSPRFLLEQGRVIGAFLAGATRSLLPAPQQIDHSEILRLVRAPSLPLQQAYAGWARARPGRYDGVIPPHLVPCQIALPVISALTARSPYPLLGVLNQGIHLALHAPLPATAVLTVRGHLVDASDDGYRARIHSTLTVGTTEHPAAMTLDAYAAVVLARRPESPAGARAEPAWTTIDAWQAGGDEGLKFFYLTGDFNPIHTWPAFARRTAFKGCIMHGYGAFAQVFEAIGNAGWDIADIDVKFVKPLPLPSPEVRIQVTPLPDESGRHALRLADAAGNVYQAGSFRAR